MDHFGELALIYEKSRSLTVRVKSVHCKILLISKGTFMTLLPVIQPYLMMDYYKGSPNSRPKKIPSDLEIP